MTRPNTMHALVTITTMLGVIQTQILEQSLDMIAKKDQCDNLKADGCTRIQRFSNPTYLFNGKPLGNEFVDNARWINEVSADVAKYYTSNFNPTPTPAPIPCNGHIFGLELLTDDYGSETTWQLKDSTGALIAEGGSYPNNAMIEITKCIGEGTHEFTIFDSYSDGICWYVL